mmetsp:Transcript_5397/g.10846  ORF Transcript_5397/g.10846 Transcript_5397/m.10846 type:complete len:2216 (-) Transcript_5397:296-6943(-)
MKGMIKVPVVGMAVLSRKLPSSFLCVTKRMMSTPAPPLEHKPMGMLPKKQGMYDPAQERDNCGVGMIANLRKDESHRIVKNALQVLERMAHRGGCGCEVNTGDGSGLLVTIPHTFYAAEMKKQGVELPPRGEYGTGLVFFSQKEDVRNKCIEVIKARCEEKGFELLAWRDVPTNNSTIGPSALACEPKVMQLFLVPRKKLEPLMLETELMILRRLFEREIADKFANEGETDFYPCTLSSRTIVYKGMLTPEQVREYYLDLQNESFETYLALVHSRFSTNTFPSWNRAQPMRMLCHNGEINTLKGNANWMSARESVIESPTLGAARTQQMLPVIDKNQSDSGSYDNVLEFLYHGSDRSLAECMLMMIPEPWQNDGTIAQERKDFYRFYSNVMEPWDGPAMIAFTNGDVIGATLDRNGLRPSRYYVTDKDGSGKPEEVILSSEVGCLQEVLAVESVIERGRLRPGQIFMVDLNKGELVRDNELKNMIASNAPYGDWSNQMITMDEVLKSSPGIPEDERSLRATNRLLTAHGYTSEAIDTIVTPMGASGKEALGSMGNDAPLACLSLKPRLLYEYFKQLFAQVTTPPVDPLRESLVMSLRLPLGPEGNLLDKSDKQSKRIELDYPLLGLEEMHALKKIDYKDYKCFTIDCTMAYEDASKPPTREEYLSELTRIETEASQAVKDGYKLICLSDVAVGPTRIPIDSMLAVGSVHQHLIRNKQRTLVGLMLESGSAHQVHHYALLFGMGADAVCPYMCYHALFKARDQGSLGLNYTDQELTDRVKSAFDYGVRKVMAKMGISTMQSYHGAQIFEALGIHQEIMDRAFTGTPSRINGIDFDIVLQDTLRYHGLAYPKDPEATGYLPSYVASSRFAYVKVGGAFDEGDEKYSLPNLGDFHYRDGGELHYNAPEQMALLQEAARKNSREAYSRYKTISHELVKGVTLRGQLDFNTKGVTPVPIEEVEPVAEIVKRFTTGAMSMGSISKETHEALGIAMNKIGAKSNTGEGGETPERVIDPVRSSAIKQIASGRFGVTSNYLTNAIQLQIKMAQGAKPGEGGELPGFKVSVDIGKLRHSTPGVGLISPPPHHDIYSIEDLAQLIYDLKCANPGARVSVKLVSEVGVGVVAAGVAKAKADHILISGHDGGTGAAQWGGIKSTGLPWELGLTEAHQTLVLNDLRSRVVVETDGQIKTGRDVVMAFLLGAEETGFSTAPLISLGCIMMRKCHLNTCPVGIATQDPELRAKFAGTPEHVVNYLFLVAEECREIMAKLGVRKITELVGRCDLLQPNADHIAKNPKLKDLDLLPVIVPAKDLKSTVLNQKDCDQWLKENHKIQKQDHGVDEERAPGLQVIDHHLIKSIINGVSGGTHTATGEYHKHVLSGSKLVAGSQKAVTTLAEAVEHLRSTKAKVEVETTVTNLNRSMGTILSNELAKAIGEDATPFGTNPLPDGSIKVKCSGSAGQSFGGFLSAGVELDLEGDANDYCGKGLCGGVVSVYPPKVSSFVPEDNIIVGNVCLYGATGGKFFARGVAAERFAVRNSGAYAVVEGCGDHGCEYMTGGRVVVLGKVGINFAAGMSGGRAYLWDPTGKQQEGCTMEEDPKKEYGPLSAEFEGEVKQLIEEHLAVTGSEVAKKILADWATSKGKFLQVYPADFKRAQAEAAAEEKAGSDVTKNLTADEKEMIGVDPAPDAKAKVGDLEDMGSSRPIVVAAPKKRRGFIEYERGAAGYHKPEERVKHFNEIYVDRDEPKLKTQGARCMNCGIPFCHQNATGCPLGNKIPEWNELVYEGQWETALQRLLMTNNFPEFTGRVCPAPCEGACVLGIIEQPVTIKNIECAIIDKAFEEGWIKPTPPTTRTGKKVAIIGSGPAGMAAADQLNKAGHTVTVYERADRVGGLMMYGVPNMKADKEKIVQRRVDLMAAEGIVFKTGQAGNIGGANHPLGNDLLVGSEAPPSPAQLVSDFDAVLCSTGATSARDMGIPGRELKGIHFAMEFLHRNTKSILDSGATGENWMEKNDGNKIDAKGKKVIVIGGGDTGNDCIGTSIRHGASNVVNFELLPKPKDGREATNPWPQWPRIYRVDYGHSEADSQYGKDPREFLISSKRFVGDADGNVTGIETVRVEWTKDEKGQFKMSEVPGSEQLFEADLVFLSMGFLGPEKTLIDQLQLAADPRGNIKADFGSHTTSVGKVFAAGDCRRGQSLVVWAIREGREAAREMDKFLMGSSALP